jgi:Na+-driven multidrug efflux pump
VDAQSYRAIVLAVSALGYASLRRPRRRRLLAAGKGAMVGGLVGALSFTVPLLWLYVTHMEAIDPLQSWLLKFGALCGIFYGLPLGMWGGLIALEVRMWRSRRTRPPAE